jgi:hypothetical protein
MLLSSQSRGNLRRIRAAVRRDPGVVPSAVANVGEKGEFKEVHREAVCLRPLIRAAEPQDLDQFPKMNRVADPGPVAALRVSRIIGGAAGNKRGELVLQRFQQP